MTQSKDKTDRLRQGLGLMSIGLGVPQLVSPGRVTRIAGVGDGKKQQTIAMLVGARELVHAAGLLSPRLRGSWIWTRVAGDAIDLTVLGIALRNSDSRSSRVRTAASTALVAGIAAVDAYAALSSPRGDHRRTAMTLTGTTTVRKPPQDAYDAWRQFDRLPTFMAHVEQVDVTGPKTSHWKASAPFGRAVEWDAEITTDEPGRRISWHSTNGTRVPNSGSVKFVEAPGGRGTEVHVELSYALPGGKVGEAAARYFGEDPHQQLDDDLRRFKQVMETGEIVRSDGAPGGKRARNEFPQHPAQPLSDDELVKEGLA